MSEPLALFRKGLVSAFGPVASFSTAAHRRVGGPITGHRDRFIRPRAVGGPVRAPSAWLVFETLTSTWLSGEPGGVLAFTQVLGNRNPNARHSPSHDRPSSPQPRTRPEAATVHRRRSGRRCEGWCGTGGRDHQARRTTRREPHRNI